MINNRLSNDIISILHWVNDNARPASDLEPATVTVSNEVWFTPHPHTLTLPQLVVMPITVSCVRTPTPTYTALSDFIQDEIRKISTLTVKEEAKQQLALLALFLAKMSGISLARDSVIQSIYYYILSENHAFNQAVIPTLSMRNRLFTPLLAVSQTLGRHIDEKHDILSLRIKKGEQYIANADELASAFKEKCELTVEKPVILHYVQKDGRTLDLRQTALALGDTWNPELASLIAQSVNLIVPEVGQITAEDILTLLPVLPPSLAGTGADFHS